MSARFSAATAPASPWDAWTALGRQQANLATECTCAMWRTTQDTLCWWQQMSVAGLALQARLLQSLGVPDPEALLTSANVLE